MQREETEPYWMQWIPCSMMECSAFYAASPNASRLNAVDFMQHGPKDLDWMCGFHSLWLNSVYSMQRGQMHPDWMQWSLCSVKKWNPLNVVDFMQHDWMQWIPCIMIECSWFYAAWPKASRLNAVDSMQRHWMKRIPCIVAQRIPIVCSGVHAARPNASRLNAVRFMQHGPKHPDGMQWIPCSEIECSVLHAAW